MVLLGVLHGNEGLLDSHLRQGKLPRLAKGGNYLQVLRVRFHYQLHRGTYEGRTIHANCFAMAEAPEEAEHLISSYCGRHRISLESMVQAHSGNSVVRIEDREGDEEVGLPPDLHDEILQRLEKVRVAVVLA